MRCGMRSRAPNRPTVYHRFVWSRMFTRSVATPQSGPPPPPPPQHTNGSHSFVLHFAGVFPWNYQSLGNTKSEYFTWPRVDGGAGIKTLRAARTHVRKEERNTLARAHARQHTKELLRFVQRALFYTFWRRLMHVLGAHQPRLEAGRAGWLIHTHIYKVLSPLGSRVCTLCAVQNFAPLVYCCSGALLSFVVLCGARKSYFIILRANMSVRSCQQVRDASERKMKFVRLNTSTRQRAERN